MQNLFRKYEQKILEDTVSLNKNSFFCTSVRKNILSKNFSANRHILHQGFFTIINETPCIEK